MSTPTCRTPTGCKAGGMGTRTSTTLPSSANCTERHTACVRGRELRTNKQTPSDDCKRGEGDTVSTPSDLARWLWGGIRIRIRLRSGAAGHGLGGRPAVTPPMCGTGKATSSELMSGCGTSGADPMGRPAFAPAPACRPRHTEAEAVAGDACERSGRIREEVGQRVGRGRGGGDSHHKKCRRRFQWVCRATSHGVVLVMLFLNNLIFVFYKP